MARVEMTRFDPEQQKPKQLKDAEHDRADEGDRHVRSHNTQPTDERTHEGHWAALPG
jgi:hypothetical protein